MKKIFFTFAASLLLVNSFTIKTMYEGAPDKEGNTPIISINCLGFISTNQNPVKTKLLQQLQQNPSSLLNMDFFDTKKLSETDQADLILKALELSQDEKIRDTAAQVIEKMVKQWKFNINACDSRRVLPILQVAVDYENQRTSLNLVFKLLTLGANPFNQRIQTQSYKGKLSPYQVFYTITNSDQVKSSDQETRARMQILKIFGNKYPKEANTFLQKELTKLKKTKSLITSLLPSTEK